MESGASVESALGMCAAITASSVTAGRSTSVNVSGLIGVTRAAVVPRSVVAGTPMGVIPGARTNEHATHKVARPPIAVRGTGVRIIGIVAVSADRLRSDIHRAYANTYSNLRIRATRSGKKQNPQQACIF